MKQGYIIHFRAHDEEGRPLFEGNRAVLVNCGEGGFVDPHELLDECNSMISTEHKWWRTPDGKKRSVDAVIIESVMKL